MSTPTIYADQLPDVRLTRRGRVVSLLVLVAVLFALLGVWSAGSVAVPAGARLEPTQTVVVTPGQTLWDIAIDAEPGADPRATIERIRDLNGLSSGTALQVGQDIALPSR